MNFPSEIQPSRNIWVDPFDRGAVFPKMYIALCKAQVQPTASTSVVQNVQHLWREIAQQSALCCFDAEGYLNTRQINDLIEFWENVYRRSELYENIPGIEFIQEQTLVVLENLNSFSQTGSLPDILLSASGTIPNANGETILKNMRISPDFKGAIPQAILQSLFTPHRQMCLPTCSINALINAEIFNHPERLAHIYFNILTTNDSEITLPVSNKQLQLQTILDPNQPMITVNCNQSVASMQNAFINLAKFTSTSSNTYGIQLHSPPSAHTVSGKKQVSFSLDIPIHDLNDFFFANFMNAIYSTTDQSEVFIKVRELYFNIAGNDFGQDSNIFNVDKKVEDEDFFSYEKICQFISKAQELVRNGAKYALVTIFSNSEKITSPSGAALNPYCGHVENINLKKLASIDQSSLAEARDGAIWIIGDRNWVDEEFGNPIYLIIRKTREGYLIFGVQCKNGKLYDAGSMFPVGIGLYV